MALVDLMTTSRLSRSSSSVTATVLDSEGDTDSELASSHIHRMLGDADADGATTSCSYGETAPVLPSTFVSSAVTSMAYLPSTVVLSELRHDSFEGGTTSAPSNSGLVSKWRPKDRMKTGYVALVLCLNISVDPPDVIKISPCARLECWIDPFSMAPPKALETIGKVLSIQYERWQPKARYKVQLDPTIDEVKKLCNTCRKYAKSERVLFHYNGHGVPKPTANGEIWLFNKSYTQYIPLPINDLDSWLKTPSIYVFDCSAAGIVINAFMELQDSSVSSSSGSARDCILLAACEAHENLPQNADFPADVFTSCLTTPIKMALRWFCRRSLLREFLDYSIIDKIPGRQNDRKTLLGELNWIFTAVTDTIAWNVLPHDLFQRLFRQDLLVASLFRNFLLAERIMRSANCSPISHPLLPSTHQHHMWEAWDMAAEICLSQLPSLIEDPNTEFQSSPFFTEQLTAFEVWLDHGSDRRKPPEQLPIVLQVLLSQCHRFRALVLLGRFLDRGSWEVDLALSVGIFPYVLKLLQTTTPELRQILVFIWTKILALDKSCQVDLVKDGGHTYFIRFLDSIEAYPEQRAMAAFVLAVIVDGHRRGQEACIEAGLIQICLKHLVVPVPNDAQAEPLFIQWLCLCLGKLWEDYTEAQFIGLAKNAPALLSPLLSEPQPEVRASAVFALGTLLDIGGDVCKDGISRDEDCDDDDEKNRVEYPIISSILSVASDGSPMVRAEVAAAFARFAFGHKHHLKLVASSCWKSQPTSGLHSVPSLVNVHCSGSGYANNKQYTPHASIVSSQFGLHRVGSDSSTVTRDGRVSSSSPLTRSPILHESPFSDDSSQNSDSGLANEAISNGVLTHSRPKHVDNSVYSQCVQVIDKLSKDPSPRVASLGRRVASIIGIEQGVARPSSSASPVGRVSESVTSSPTAIIAGLARSSSWFDMHAAHLPLSFRTPPVSPPRPSYIAGMRRVCSLEFRPHLLNTPDSGLADPLLGSSGGSDRCLLPQSTIYSWSCGHFSKPLLTAPDDGDEILARREERERSALDQIAKCQHSSVSRLNNRIAGWDTRFESGVKAVLLQPFAPVVVAADGNERIRVWNCEEPVLLNSFDNHALKDKGISKLCLLNELDDSLLLVASSDGNVRIWRDYSTSGGQRLVTAFCSADSCSPHHNSVVDWQQQSGYLFSSGDTASIMVWDLDKEQLTKSIPSSSDSSVSSLSASHIHGGQFAVGFADGSVKLYDIRTPEMVVYATRPHVQKVERVVGIGFQPGLDPAKIVSASQSGHIKFLDTRNCRDAYLTIDAFRGSLTSLALHRHAPVIACGSAKQIIKVFSVEGEPLGAIRYQLSLMAQKIGPVNCLAFHPYQVLLGAGDADACVSIYADEGFQAK